MLGEFRSQVLGVGSPGSPGSDGALIIINVSRIHRPLCPAETLHSSSSYELTFLAKVTQICHGEETEQTGVNFI